jgi:hypothetical protein
MEAGRLRKEEGKVDEAKHHFETAVRMIKENGCHRRDGEVEKFKTKMFLSVFVRGKYKQA